MHHHSRLILLLSAVVSCAFAAQINPPDTIVITDDTPALSISRSVGIFVDPGTSRTIADVSSPDSGDLFAPNKSLTANFGITSSAVWIRFTVRNATEQNILRILEIGVPVIHYADLYAPGPSGAYTPLHSGFMVPAAKRPVRTRWPAFELRLRPGETATYYLRCRSETSIILPLSVMTPAAYVDNDRRRQDLLGMYFGALAAMALFNLLLFIPMRDRSFVYFALFMLGLMLGQMMSVYGWLFDVLIPGMMPGAYRFLHVTQFATVVFALLFARTMLALPKIAPRLDRVLLALAGISIAAMAASPFLSFAAAEQVLVPLNIGASLLSLAGGVTALFKKYRPAIFYLAAVGTSIVGFVIYNCMYGYNLIPFSQFVYFSPNISFMATMLLFAMALADRYMILSREKQHANTVAMSNLRQAARFQGEKERLEDELFQARKLEAIGQLAGGIAHDLKNILTPIYGYAELLRMQSGGAGQVSDYSGKIIAAANQAKDITSKLLSFARKDKRRSVSLDMNGILSEVVGLLEHAIDRRIQLKRHLDAAAATVMGDAMALKNAVLNLALNAKDAMPDGGSITFRSRICALDERNTVCQTFSLPAGEFVAVSVSDTGTGMSPQTLERLFEPYFTTKGPEKGTGLGLASVYGCVKSHKGGIEVDSTPGSGSTFTIYLPFVPVTASAGSPDVVQIAKGAGTIMLVDDEPAIREVGTDVLTGLGYRVVCCANGEKAVAHFSDHADDVDLVIMDMMMPVMDGRTCLGELRRLDPEVRVIMMTGYSDAHEIESVMNAGVSGFIHKPFEIEGLSRMVAENIR